ncbi:MAG: acyltransferase family protein [Desulfovibrionaceae bacterium]
MKADPNISLLRGAAILSVLLNHYLNDYVPVDATGYANGCIAIFFFLSGKLSSASINRNPAPLTVASIARYYLKRALRIYPLLWLFLAINPNNVDHGQLSWSGLAITDLPWFVSAMVHCYLCCLPFFGIRRISDPASRVLAFVVFSIGLIVAFDILLPSTPPFVYRGVPGGHLLLFGFGVAVQDMSVPEWLRRNTGRVAAVLAFAVSVYATRLRLDTFALSPILTGLSLTLATAILCSAFTAPANPTSPPVKQVRIPHVALAQLGDYSYGVYLFHMMYFNGLAALGLLKRGSVSSALYALALFPLFFMSVRLVEDASNAAARVLFSRIAGGPDNGVSRHGA